MNHSSLHMHLKSKSFQNNSLSPCQLDCSSVAFTSFVLLTRVKYTTFELLISYLLSNQWPIFLCTSPLSFFCLIFCAYFCACLHNWYLESSQIEGKTCDLWGEGRIVLSPIKWRDSRVPSDVIVLRGLEFLAVFLFNIERLELETVFWYRQLVGGVGQRDTPK